MAYIGIKLKVPHHVITAKLHGPFDTFVISTTDLREFLNDFTSAKINMIEDANLIAKSIIDRYYDGDSILWAEVEIESSNGIIYNAVAEKENANG